MQKKKKIIIESKTLESKLISKIFNKNELNLIFILCNEPVSIL